MVILMTDKDREALSYYLMTHVSMTIHMGQEDLKKWHDGQEIYTKLKDWDHD